MQRRTLIIAVLIVAAAGAIAYATRASWSGSNASVQAAPRPRTVSVEMAKAERRSVPVDVEALGTVTPLASVALKSRLETTILAVHFQDGAKVEEGDLLFTLDSRQIDAQIQQAEGTLARDQAQLAGAQRDLRRFSELIGKGATTQVNVDNAKTQSDILTATIQSDRSALENLKVQKSYTQIRAPVSGRISAAAVKVGNFVRPADTASLATINQMVPVYVTFSVPQRVLADLREAMQKATTKVVATIPNSGRSAQGTVAMIENTVDSATGMVTVRGIMNNADETLWPGTLVQARLTVRMEEAVVVPTVAVQRSQTGTFVFVVEDGTTRVRQVRVDRTVEGYSVVGDGLKGGEDVVTDGQLLLSDGTKVEPRNRKAGA
jgi:RND family efflux transporter MFP subunit